MTHPHTFFFYDLETSGIDPKSQRIMQFAGQRTDDNLQPIGEPIDILVRLNDDVLPDPTAIMITGITPQKTQEEGYSEAEFLAILHKEVIVPNTTILGFNSIRFDDEFMRHTLYRNFYDPYEWQWQDGRSRWDLLDVVRMTRALRPEGIEWPFDDAGNATNRLELLSAKNKLEHENAHDALSDVRALISVARLLKEKQPKLFTYLLGMRDKKSVAQLVSLDAPQPFVYASGRYPKEYLHTTVAYPIGPAGTPGSTIVYDLRHDPDLWKDYSIEQLKAARFATREQRKAPGFLPLPAKEIAANRCPAVAPIGVLDGAAQERIALDLSVVQQNLQKLLRSDLPDRLRQVFERGSFPRHADVDGQLYSSFIGQADKPKMRLVRESSRDTITDVSPLFGDERLAALLPRYKARNYPNSLNATDRETWEGYRAGRVASDLPRFSKELQRLAQMHGQDDRAQFLLQELQLWAESITPAD